MDTATGAAEPSGAGTIEAVGYRDAIEVLLDDLAAHELAIADALRAFRAEAARIDRDFPLWEAASAIWMIVREAWPQEEADAFFEARDAAQAMVDTIDERVGAALSAIVAEFGEEADLFLGNAAVNAYQGTSVEAFSRAVDQAAWEAAGAHHVATAGALTAVLGDSVPGHRYLLSVPWSVLRDATEDERFQLLAVHEGATVEAVRHLAAELDDQQRPDNDDSALWRLLRPVAGDLHSCDFPF